eukprot:6983118-Pyramimonas_sp.AAC.1
MLASDTIHVNFNGVSTVSIDQGIAEGGTLGPLTFPESAFRAPGSAARGGAQACPILSRPPSSPEHSARARSFLGQRI